MLLFYKLFLPFGPLVIFRLIIVMIVTEIFMECYSLSFFYASFLLLSACFLLPVNAGGKGFPPTEGEREREREKVQTGRENSRRENKNLVLNLKMNLLNDLIGDRRRKVGWKELYE